MVESQFLEVNWFSKWTELVEEEELLRKAKKFYGDGDFKSTCNKLNQSLFPYFPEHMKKKIKIIK